MSIERRAKSANEIKILNLDVQNQDISKIDKNIPRIF